jgi:hypothetical protein
MRLILYYAFISAIILIGCDKDKNSIADNKQKIPACNVVNPIEDLDWLKELKNSFTNCTCQVSILQGKYQENTVFYYMVTDPLCNSVFQVTLWDCNGDMVKEYKPGENDIFYSEVELVCTLYTCTK